uniref:Uncharacterized protein n=1 Tax=Vespula pensylvanica TaxID=30213 RepID=A0A834UDZ9_VESPE|nr:hypothetical protein H0235_002419 [Vespula pensylvanica]
MRWNEKTKESRFRGLGPNDTRNEQEDEDELLRGRETWLSICLLRPGKDSWFVVTDPRIASRNYPLIALRDTPYSFSHQCFISTRNDLTESHGDDTLSGFAHKAVTARRIMPTVSGVFSDFGKKPKVSFENSLEVGTEDKEDGFGSEAARRLQRASSSPVRAFLSAEVLATDEDQLRSP